MRKHYRSTEEKVSFYVMQNVMYIEIQIQNSNEIASLWLKYKYNDYHKFGADDDIYILIYLIWFKRDKIKVYSLKSTTHPHI
jgi:hypothetical protein